MDIDLTIKNYRCFGRSAPARLDLRQGFIAFVGPNNGGKSTLLKFFVEFRPLFVRLANKSTNLGTVPGAPTSLADPTEIFCDAEDGDLEIDVSLPSLKGANPRTIDRITIALTRESIAFSMQISAHGRSLGPIHAWVDGVPVDSSSNPLGDPTALHEAFGRLASTYSIGAFRTTLASAGGTSQDAEIGGSLISRWRQLKTGSSKPNRQAAILLIDQIRDVFGFREFDVDVADQNNELIATIDRRSYSFAELGSGLGHFVVSLVTLATRARNAYLLIDEPENGLHPSLQLEFLTALGRQASDGVLFATHSYGLARQMADQIYTVHRRPTRRISEVRHHNEDTSLSEFLGELGFSGYRDLGIDSVLLVEGRTDAQALRQLLPRGTNTTTVLLPLGGATGINGGAGPELVELIRIAPRVRALIDSERAAPNDQISPERIAFREACKSAGIPCHVLERRALENYFPEGAIRRGLRKPKASALGPFERLDDRWPKSENWRIASNMTADDLAGTDLGSFLASVASPADDVDVSHLPTSQEQPTEGT
jgi:predicted ATPase